jgi:hypothetical protein
VPPETIAVVQGHDADERQLLELGRRLGVIEAVEVLAGALIEKLAGNPETTDNDLAALHAIEESAFRSRQAAKPSSA